MTLTLSVSVSLVILKLGSVPADRHAPGSPGHGLGWATEVRREMHIITVRTYIEGGLVGRPAPESRTRSRDREFYGGEALVLVLVPSGCPSVHIPF